MLRLKPSVFIRPVKLSRYCYPVCSADSILGLHGERGDGSIILTPVDQSSYRESGMIYLADIIMASL